MLAKASSSDNDSSSSAVPSLDYDCVTRSGNSSVSSRSRDPETTTLGPIYEPALLPTDDLADIPDLALAEATGGVRDRLSILNLALHGIFPALASHSSATGPNFATSRFLADNNEPWTARSARQPKSTSSTTTHTASSELVDTLLSGFDAPSTEMLYDAVSEDGLCAHAGAWIVGDVGLGHQVYAQQVMIDL